MDSVDVGVTANGYELSLDVEYEDIGETDAYGLTVIDGVWRGANCFLQFTSKAYKAGSVSAFWPFGAGMAAPGVLGTIYDDAVANPNKLPIAQLATNFAKAMVLTSTAGTPAVATPATLTATKAAIARNSNGKLLFDSRLREVPVRLRLYPVLVANVLKFFTLT